MLDGERSYTQSEETGKKARITYEQGQRAMRTWAPAREGEVEEQTEEALKGNRFAISAKESEDHREVHRQGFTRRA